MRRDQLVPTAFLKIGLISACLTHLFLLFRVPLIHMLALENSFLDHTCMLELVSLFCGPLRLRPSPPCRREVIRHVRYTLEPTWLALLCLHGRWCPVSPSCSRCGKTLNGHEQSTPVEAHATQELEFGYWIRKTIRNHTSINASIRVSSNPVNAQRS